jgi:hypothetical protein
VRHGQAGGTEKNDGAVSMEESAKKKSSNGNEAGHRPPFTIVDWIVAALSIALMVFILMNLPPV